MRKVTRASRRRLTAIVEAYGDAQSLAALIPGGSRRMVIAWLTGKKLPMAKRAERVNALARAKALPIPFTVVALVVPPTLPGDRLHRPRTFKNRELGAVVRAYGDVFLFARAARVVVATVYRWAARLHYPQAHLAARVNELARAKKLADPYAMRETTSFRGRGKLANVVRAYGGVARFSAIAGTSPTSLRVWLRDKDVRPLAEVRARVNALAKDAELSEPFPGARAPRFRGRGPLADLVRAYGGAAGLARAAQVGETSVYRWARGTAPWRSVAADVNTLARAKGLAEPFIVAKCPVKTAEDWKVTLADVGPARHRSSGRDLRSPRHRGSAD